jgi:hypothetical protein
MGQILTSRRMCETTEDVRNYTTVMNKQKCQFFAPDVVLSVSVS